MAKNKNVDFNYEELAELLDGEVLDNVEIVKQWIDTGNLALNFLCSGRFYGGGVPAGKIIEIFGGSSSCKTLLGQNILKGCQKAQGLPVFLDAENTLSRDFAQKVSHLDPKRVIVIRADTLQKAFGKIHDVVRKAVSHYGNEKPVVIIYDSIAVSPSEREFAETKVDENASKAQKKAAGAGPEQPGERARICSSELRKLNPVISNSNTTVIIINQVRQKIGVMFGNPETTAGGGNALEFYCSLRLRTSASRKLKNANGNVVGMKVSVSNVKNKCFRPFVHVRDMNLYFDRGINPVSGLLELLLQEGRIQSGKAGNYQVNPQYADGREVKFKASLEKNEMPVDILLDCPKLIDAFGQEELSAYFAASSLSSIQEDDIEEELNEDE